MSGSSDNSVRSGVSSMSLRSPKVRKEILRDVLTRAEILTEETVSDSTIQKLDECMEETDTINCETTLDDKLNNQEEVLLDSKMMNISTQVLQKCTRSLTNSMCSYSHVEFAKKLVDYVRLMPEVETSTPDWSLLGAEIAKYCKVTPHYNTFLGTLAPLEKKEIVRKHAVRDVQAPIKKPVNVVVADEEEDTMEHTVQMKEVISKYFKTHHKPLDFFKLILHPTDFGKTIENILHISFHARDGNVLITKDSTGRLVVQPRSKEMGAQVKAGEITNVQNVMYLNMSRWKTLVKAYGIKEPMIDPNKT